MNSQPPDSRAGDGKKSYAPPRLTTFGTVGQLTQMTIFRGGLMIDDKNEFRPRRPDVVALS